MIIFCCYSTSFVVNLTTDRSFWDYFWR